MRIFFSCGETSGDRYAATIIQALPSNFKAFGNGGEKMAAVGCELLVNVVRQSAIGFIEPLIKIPFFLNVLRKTKQFILINDIQTVVIIDHQGFNIPLAKWCKSKNIRVISFIAPQFWIWGQKNKAVKFCAYCDHIACIFKDEYEYYHAIDSKKTFFVGHPLMTLLPERMTSKDVVIGLFPGSRSQEIKYCLPVMIEAVKKLRTHDPNLRFKLAVASQEMAEELNHYSIDDSIERVFDSSRLIAEAHVSMVASGTVSLEHALIGTPCVVMYKFSWLSYAIAKLLVKKKIDENCHGFMALPNILAKQEICPELLQDQLTCEKVVLHVTDLLTNDASVKRMTSAFSSLRSQLNNEQCACKCMAQYLTQL